MTTDLIAFIEARLAEDELWAKAASAGREPEDGTVPGGVHWTWAVGDQWQPVEPDPLEPYMGGHGGEWSQPVVLRTVEEWQLDWGGPDNTLPLKVAESEELRTADGAHIARHDPARVLREVEAKRRLLALHPHHRYVEPLDAASVHEEDHRPAFDESPRYVGCTSCHYNSRHEECYPSWWCEHVRLLALPYAEHPDYRQEWSA